MIRVYNNPKYAGDRVMLLFTNPTDVERVVEGGVKITSVNIGGMAFRQGKTQVNNAISVDEKTSKPSRNSTHAALNSKPVRFLPIRN